MSGRHKFPFYHPSTAPSRIVSQLSEIASSMQSAHPSRPTHAIRFALSPLVRVPFELSATLPRAQPVPPAHSSTTGIGIAGNNLAAPNKSGSGIHQMLHRAETTSTYRFFRYSVCPATSALELGLPRSLVVHLQKLRRCNTVHIPDTRSLNQVHSQSAIMLVRPPIRKKNHQRFSHCLPSYFFARWR